MSIVRAAVGEHVMEFGDTSDIRAVWAFVSSHMADLAAERAIVLVQDGGDALGRIWDGAQFRTIWSTPGKMAAYLQLADFDCADDE